MESRKSVRKLAESIRSLLGLKSQLTSTWADSVCSIIKDLPSQQPSFASSEKEYHHSYTSVSKIQDDLAALTNYLNQLNIQRRQALSDFLDLKGNIRVFCRVRPVTEGLEFFQPRHAVSTDSNNIFLRLSESKSKRYSFDKVFHPGSSQDEVFSEVEPVIKSALDGYNACIFAYGQTGTGKTFTMEGKSDCPGVVPRAIEALFKQAEDSSHTFFFTFSMLEIYMGHLKDLLIPQRMKPTDSMTQCLSIQTDPKGGIEIENLVTIRVSDFNQARRLYALGSRFRSTASTNSNATSSRSHCLTRISMTCFNAPERRRETNKIWMIDLGGSERVLKTKTWGRRFEEGKSINLSLSALGDVINALQRRKSHVPYRNSKLTQVLRDSLGEDSRTLMLVHVSPKEEDLCETVCSLGFATRVRSIHLGTDESSEVQVRKELEMAKLLQKVKQLENELQGVREKVKKLKGRLDIKKDTSSNEHLDSYYLYSEVLQDNTKMERESTANLTSSSSLQLPRFMKPTVSSRRKFGMDHPTKNIAQRKGRNPTRRKASSVLAESVTFPLKGISEVGSDYSISKTSCLTDYGTEYSQNASECDIKMVVNIDSSDKNSVQGLSNLDNKSFLDSGNVKGVDVDYSKCLTLDDWLCVEKNGPSNTYAQGNKRVRDIPLPSKINFSSQSKANAVCSRDYTKENVKHDEVGKETIVGLNARSTAEVVIHRTQNLLDVSVIVGSGPDPISLNDKFGQGVLECPGSEDDRCCSGFIQTQQMVIIDETLCPKTSKDAGHDVIGLNEEFYDPILECEWEAQNQNWPKEVFDEIPNSPQKIVVNNQTTDEVVTKQQNEKSYFCVSPQHARRPCLYSMKARRSLSMSLNDVDHTISLDNPGAFDVLGQKVETIRYGALLGMGFQNLGLDQDFFYALTL